LHSKVQNWFSTRLSGVIRPESMGIGFLPCPRLKSLIVPPSHVILLWPASGHFFSAAAAGR